MIIKTDNVLQVFYAAVSIIVLFSGSFHPLYNWDIIPYIASAKALGSNDPILVHSFTYTEIDKSAGTRKYASSSAQEDSSFRALMRSDYSAFSDLLLFYKIRVVYNLAVYSLLSVGIAPVFATHFISAVSIFLATWMLFLIGRHSFSIPLQFVILPLVLGLGAYKLARLSTPDALAFLLVLAIIYCFLKEHPAIYFLFPLLVAVRTDLLLLVVLLGLSLLFLKTPGIFATLVSLVISVSIFFLLEWVYSYPGWKAVFYFTFCDKSALTTPPEFGPDLYFPVFYEGIRSVLKSPQFFFFLAIIGLALFFSTYKLKGILVASKLKSKSVILLLTAIIYFIIRMIVFPLAETRFLVIPYTIAAISFCELFSPVMTAFNRRDAALDGLTSPPR